MVARRNVGRQALAVDIKAFQLDRLTVSSAEHAGNNVVSDAENRSTLYVELEDGAASVPISFFPTLTGPAIPISAVHWRVTGPNGFDESGTFDDADDPIVDLTEAGATYIIGAGFDSNASGALDAGEVLLEADAVVVRIDGLAGREVSFVANQVAASKVTANLNIIRVTRHASTLIEAGKLFSGRSMARRLQADNFIARPCTLIVALLIVLWYLRFLLTQATLDSKYHGIDHAIQLLMIAALWPIATAGLVRLWMVCVKRRADLSARMFCCCFRRLSWVKAMSA